VLNIKENITSYRFRTNTNYLFVTSKYNRIFILAVKYSLKKLEALSFSFSNGLQNVLKLLIINYIVYK